MLYARYAYKDRIVDLVSLISSSVLFDFRFFSWLCGVCCCSSSTLRFLTAHSHSPRVPLALVPCQNFLSTPSLCFLRCCWLRHRRSISCAFDHVFGGHASQEDVFKEVSSFVQSALDGYKVRGPAF